ncbi:2-phospho-L-lactate guanylyltransferase [Methanocaldococcus indicus]|uniref:2-phospho-L-lactate guanylyltransferase n=1 Tax=Methanocaldococcus indicus TaxID=213231 RepID=UPI003C6D2197
MNVIIPVSPLNNLKTRLSNFLTEVERKELIFNMLRDITKVLDNLNVYIVSKDEKILNFAKEELKVDIIKEKSSGLNNALYQAFEVVKNNILVIPADIPLIKKKNIEDVIKLSKNYDLIISPSRGGGTNLLYLKDKDTIKLRYEGFSFLKHLEEAKKRNLKYYVYDSFYISVDINTVEDLGEIFIHGENTYTKRFLENIIEVYPLYSSAGRFKVVRK